MKNVTLVLSGTGVAGYASIALMELFEQTKIKPYCLVACSTASLVAALWGKGYTAKEATLTAIKAHEKNRKARLNLMTLLTLFKSPRGRDAKFRALFSPQKIRAFYQRTFKDDCLEELSIPTYLQTTDVKNGEGFLLQEGLLSKAIYASSALLPFFPAIKINERWLIDGTFSEPIPLKMAVDKASDLIIVLSSERKEIKQKSNFMAHYARFLQRSSRRGLGAHVALSYNSYHGEILSLSIELPCLERLSPKEEVLKCLEIARGKIDEQREIILNELKS